MTEHKSKATVCCLNPAAETIHQKHMNLQAKLDRYALHHEEGPLKNDRKQLIEECQRYLDDVSKYFNSPFPFSRHPHLLWELLHRTDENFILLMDEDELYARAVDVKISFDMNIKEEKLRSRWIGDKGIFSNILDQVEKKEQKTMMINRQLIKEAQKKVDECMDQGYWQLSMNILTSCWSGFFLALLLLIPLIVSYFQPRLPPFLTPLLPLRNLGTSGGFCTTYLTLIGLGLMGAYLSNLLTKEDFLYVRGGPFFRCLLHNIFSKPVMSAFAAVFIYGLEKTKLIFSIGPIDSNTSQIIIINVKNGIEGYVYAVLAVTSGFAADKVLRSMFDQVLKKLEKKAEKSKDG